MRVDTPVSFSAQRVCCIGSIAITMLYSEFYDYTLFFEQNGLCFAHFLPSENRFTVPVYRTISPLLIECYLKGLID